MKESYKVLSIVCLFLVVVSVASGMGYDNKKSYSNPSVYGEHRVSPAYAPGEYPTKKVISHNDWNVIFSDWKSGKVSKEETIKILSGVRRA